MQATNAPPRRAVPPDARNVVTEDAYRLAPELLGTPLARPWRRGAAMAVDGTLIALLSNAPSVLFGLAGALILFRVSARPAAGGYLRRSARLMFRFWGAVVLFVAAITGWDSALDRVEGVRMGMVGGGERAASEELPPEVSAELSGAQAIRFAAEFARFAQADDEAEARQYLEHMVPALRGSGLDDEEVEDALRGMAEIPGKPWLAVAVDSVIRAQAAPASAPAGVGLSPDSLALAYAEAVRAEDSAAAAGLAPRLTLALAADTLAALREELTEARDDRRELASRVEELREEAERGPGLLSTLGSLADDLGLGLGWAGLYFTAFLALWSGRTPGKRLLRIRVIRLDGRPIGWWASFERFGGYAAGFATGLLGFFQIYWDRNRQAVHDKISETVVIND